VNDLWATKNEDVGLLFAQLVSQIFSLFGHDPPTFQTDGQADDMQSQDRALHCSSSHGKQESQLKQGLADRTTP